YTFLKKTKLPKTKKPPVSKRFIRINPKTCGVRKKLPQRAQSFLPLAFIKRQKFAKLSIDLALRTLCF
ncbi:hypothetical protein AAGV28_03290, partial [Flavobacterium sp. FZUC8N2.13]